MPGKKDTEVNHRKSGTVENIVDAFAFVEWFAGVLKDEGMKPMALPYYVQVELSIRPMRSDDDDE